MIRRAAIVSGAVALLLLIEGCVDSSMDAMPLSVYPIWQKFTAYDEQIQQGLLAEGKGQAFEIMHLESPWWWVFEVVPGYYEDPQVILVTTSGVYKSEYMIFADDSMYQVVLWPPVDATVAGFARHQVNGEWRIDAFARFPVIPEGDVVSWEVIP